MRISKNRRMANPSGDPPKLLSNRTSIEENFLLILMDAASLAIFDKSASRLESEVPIHLKVESLMQKTAFYIKWLLLGNKMFIQYDISYLHCYVFIYMYLI